MHRRKDKNSQSNLTKEQKLRLKYLLQDFKNKTFSFKLKSKKFEFRAWKL
jgi:hypothetical protein